MFITTALGASLAGAAVGGLLASKGSKDAANIQAGAADRAAQLQKEAYDQTVARNQPFVSGGLQSFNALLDRLGLSGNAAAPGYGTFGKVPTAQDVMNEPGYQFGLSEGQKALKNMTNARGMSYSGAALKAADRYATDYAGTQYGNAFNRNQSANQQAYNQFANLANMGQNAANNQGQAGANYATQTGAALQGGAGAQAANALAQGNIWQNALNQTVSAYKNNPMPSSNAIGVNSWDFINQQSDPFYIPPGGP